MEDEYVTARVALKNDIETYNFKGQMEAESELQKMGFDIVFENSTAFTIGGPKELFEGVFGISIEKKTKNILESKGAKSDVVYFVANGEPKIPRSLKKYVEGVYFEEPPELF